jgi:hypothetical protein
VGVYKQWDGVTLLKSIEEFFGYLVKPCKDQAYLMGDIQQQHQNTNAGRVKRDVCWDLVNSILWFVSTVFSSSTCYTGMKAAIKNRKEKRRQRKEKGTVMREVGEMGGGVAKVVSSWSRSRASTRYANRYQNDGLPLDDGIDTEPWMLHYLSYWHTVLSISCQPCNSFKQGEFTECTCQHVYSYRSLYGY